MYYKWHVVHVMESRSQSLSLEIINAFLKDIQLGSLLDANALSEKYDLPPSLKLQDFLLCSNRHGDTPFLVAARHGHVNILRVLHEEFNVPHSQCNVDGKSALHEAAQNSHVNCIHYLVQAGSNVDSLKKADWY